MELKKGHLYRAQYVKDTANGYGDRFKGYCLVVPSKTEDSRPYMYLHCDVLIDVINNFSETTSVNFAGSFEFQFPSVSDVFELVTRMKKEKNRYKYNFKTNEITKLDESY